MPVWWWGYQLVHCQSLDGVSGKYCDKTCSLAESTLHGGHYLLSVGLYRSLAPLLPFRAASSGRDENGIARYLCQVHTGQLCNCANASLMVSVRPRCVCPEGWGTFWGSGLGRIAQTRPANSARPRGPAPPSTATAACETDGEPPQHPQEAVVRSACRSQAPARPLRPWGPAHLQPRRPDVSGRLVRVCTRVGQIAAGLRAYRASAPRRRVLDRIGLSQRSRADCADAGVGEWCRRPPATVRALPRY